MCMKGGRGDIWYSNLWIANQLHAKICPHKGLATQHCTKDPESKELLLIVQYAIHNTLTINSANKNTLDKQQ